MQIEKIILRQIRLQFKKPFAASWGSFHERYPTLVEIVADGVSGWGEAAALPLPYYSHEDSDSVFYILSKYLCPAVLEKQPADTEDLALLLSRIKLNNIAKSGLEQAFWDLIARQKNTALYKILGGTKNSIECGATLPSNLDGAELVLRAQELISKGYKKIRLKLSRQRSLSDLEILFAAVDPKKIALDANGCFNLNDLQTLLAIDSLGALMIEQPLDADDLLGHAELQKQMKSPLCLDECIFSANQAAIAIKLGSARVFNIKSARLGGHAEILRTQQVCLPHNIPLVAGGMFESGIGRAHALAVASIESCKFPADLAESSYYYEQDIVEPAFSFSEPGRIRLSEKPGIGVEPLKAYIESITVKQAVF